MSSVRIMLRDCSSCGLSDFTFITKIPLQIRFVCRCTHLLKEDLASLVQLVSHSAASNYDIALLVNCRSQPTHNLLQGMAIVQSVGHWLENRRKKDWTNANRWNKGIALTWKQLDLRVAVVTTWNGSPGVNLIKLLHFNTVIYKCSYCFQTLKKWLQFIVKSKGKIFIKLTPVSSRDVKIVS